MWRTDQEVFYLTVRDEIERGRGTQFDPRFADIMLQIMDEDTDYKLREE